MASDLDVYLAGIRTSAKTTLVEPGRHRGVPVFDKNDDRILTGLSESIPAHAKHRIRSDKDPAEEK